MFRHVRVRIVFRHSRKIHIIWRILPPIKIRKIPISKRLRNLDRPIRPKIKINQRIAFLNSPHRLLIFIHNHKRRQILVLNFWIHSAQGRNRLFRRLKIIIRLAVYHHIPAPRHYRPIILVPIRHRGHSSTPRSNPNIRISKFRRELLKSLNIFWLAHRRHITPVKNRMHPHSSHTLAVGLFNHLLQMRNMAMHSPVRENSRKM